MILYFHSPYVHVKQSAFLTWYSDTLLLHRLSLDTLYWDSSVAATLNCLSEQKHHSTGQNYLTTQNNKLTVILSICWQLVLWRKLHQNQGSSYRQFFIRAKKMWQFKSYHNFREIKPLCGIIYTFQNGKSKHDSTLGDSKITTRHQLTSNRLMKCSLRSQIIRSLWNLVGAIHCYNFLPCQIDQRVCQASLENWWNMSLQHYDKKRIAD